MTIDHYASTILNHSFNQQPFTPSCWALGRFAPHVGEDVTVAAGGAKQLRGADRATELLHLA